jgi:flagellar protein FliO/FliZ
MKSLKRTAFTAASTVFLALPARAFAGPVKGPHEATPVNLGDTAQKQATTAGSSGGGLFRMLFGLLIVVGVIYGVYWVLKQVKKSREETASGRGLAPIATLPLGPGRSLHMVRAGGEVVIIGVGEHGVTPIRTYSEEEALEAGLIGVEPDELDTDDPPVSGQRSAVSEFIDNLRKATVR